MRKWWEYVKLVRPVIREVRGLRLYDRKDKKTEDLVMLGLDHMMSLKEIKVSSEELLESERPNPLMQSLSLEGMKKNIQKIAKYKGHGGLYMERNTNERQEMVGPIAFMHHVEQEKHKLADDIQVINEQLTAIKTPGEFDSLYNGDYDSMLSNEKQYYTDEEMEKAEELKAQRRAVSEELINLVVSPESYEIPLGNLHHHTEYLRKFDNVAASNALYHTKEGNYINLNTPSGVGHMARHKVEDPSKVSVLKDGEVIDRAVKVINRAHEKDDVGHTVLYSMKSKHDERHDNRRITAERYDTKGNIVSVGAEAMNEVGLSPKSFSSMVRVKNDERDAAEFNAQLSPSHIRQAMTERILSNYQHTHQNVDDNLVFKTPEQEPFSKNLDSALVKKYKDRPEVLESTIMVEESVNARALSPNDLYYLNIATGAYKDDPPEPFDQPEDGFEKKFKDTGYASAVLLKGKTDTRTALSVVGVKTAMLNDEGPFRFSGTPIHNYEINNTDNGFRELMPFTVLAQEGLLIDSREEWTLENDDSMKNIANNEGSWLVNEHGYNAPFPGPTITAGTALAALAINGYKGNATDLTERVKSGPTGEPQDVNKRVSLLSSLQEQHDKELSQTYEAEQDNSASASNRRKLR